ncbi:HNH endonuclease signature motif containing protein [Corynebacterium flavescens]|uniref:HNH endonuclease signature motif containing protein n=1 Tax=Corynebacterium flavescens TaxID=28028 RepID=UPI00289DA3D8|nr:HNH endonuclease [Corynebacterium flavescens]
MPKPVRITARSSSITNSFVNGIIPVVYPTKSEVEEVLEILGMVEPVCSYCGDQCTEWDHFRPLVIRQKPTGYISEIHNLVPACGKCNQSKGNKNWREWMFGPAPLSPKSRGISDIQERELRLRNFEHWGKPRVVDFAEIIGEELWKQHWVNHRDILRTLKHAEETAKLIRELIAAEHSSMDAPEPVPEKDTPDF